MTHIHPSSDQSSTTFYFSIDKFMKVSLKSTIDYSNGSSQQNERVVVV
jgi:hypothetical protein